MPYTPLTLRQDLNDLGISKWDWAGNGPKAPIDLQTGKAPVQNAADEIADSCWCAYDKALRAAGDQAIGTAGARATWQEETAISRASAPRGDPSSPRAWRVRRRRWRRPPQ